MSELVATYENGCCVLKRRLGYRDRIKGLDGFLPDLGIYDSVCTIPMSRKQFDIVDRRTLNRFERRMRRFNIGALAVKPWGLYDFFLDQKREMQKVMEIP